MYILLEGISIHAPTRGATILRQISMSRHIEFQFTPLREGRPGILWPRLPAAAYFNSRPYARGDFFVGAG